MSEKNLPFAPGEGQSYITLSPSFSLCPGVTSPSWRPWKALSHFPGTRTVMYWSSVHSVQSVPGLWDLQQWTSLLWLGPIPQPPSIHHVDIMLLREESQRENRWWRIVSGVWKEKRRRESEGRAQCDGYDWLTRSEESLTAYQCALFVCPSSCFHSRWTSPWTKSSFLAKTPRVLSSCQVKSFSPPLSLHPPISPPSRATHWPGSPQTSTLRIGREEATTDCWHTALKDCVQVVKRQINGLISHCSAIEGTYFLADIHSHLNKEQKR